MMWLLLLSEKELVNSFLKYIVLVTNIRCKNYITYEGVK